MKPFVGETPDCALCGGSDFETRLLGVRDLVWQKPGHFRIQECSACGLLMTRPRPNPEELAGYYEGAYSGGTGQGDAKKDGATSGLTRRLGRYRMDVIGKVRPLRKEDRVLDVGCSYGGFLKVVRDDVGCSTAGIDYDAGSIEGAIEPELCDYRSGTLVDADYDETFTVITFIECLEHDPTPLQTLTRAHDLLAPGGLVAVEVPNWDGGWRSVFGRFWLPLLIPQHLVHFRIPTLSRMVQDAGFEVVHSQTMFFPLEGVASLWLWCVEMLAIPPMGTPPTWRTPFHLLVFAGIVALWFVVELPSQLVLQWFGRTGHITVVGRKAEQS